MSLKTLQQYFPLGSSGSLAPGLTISTRYLFAYNPMPGGSAITGPVTVTATFGTGPYTYAWTNGGGGAAIAIASPTAATTTFGASASGANADYIETKVCTVTDSLLATQAISLTVEIRIGSAP